MNNQMIADGKDILDTHAKPVKLRRSPPMPPSSDDPREELRRLVMQHKALTKAAVALEHMCSDCTSRDTGETIACRLPRDIQVQGQTFADEVFRKAATKLETAMLRELRKIPIFQLYLSKLFGVKSGGPIAAYLVAEIDIRRSEKPSALRRFCGLAVIDGRLERRTKGQKNAFSSEMRTRLFQLFQTMWKNRRHDPENKYLKIWDDARHRIEQSERVFERGVDRKGEWTGKIINGQGKTVSARGFAHSYGWHKAADVFLEDLYIVWRAIEGLPVWPSYYAAKLGYEHGGKISVNAPKMLTVDEALAAVGMTESSEVSAAAE